MLCQPRPSVGVGERWMVFGTAETLRLSIDIDCECPPLFADSVGGSHHPRKWMCACDWARGGEVGAGGGG